MYRRSLAWYYYTTPTTENGVAHNTLWAPGQSTSLAEVRKKIRRLVTPKSVEATRTNRVRQAP